MFKINSANTDNFMSTVTTNLTITVSIDIKPPRCALPPPHAPC